MTTATLTLTEFLLARIAEDEAVARRVDSGPPVVWQLQAGLDHHDGTLSGWVEVDAGRVLAECEAKRRIVDDAMSAQHSLDSRRDPAPAAVHGHVLARRRVVRQLAAVYSDHPDYRDEWRPQG